MCSVATSARSSTRLLPEAIQRTAPFRVCGLRITAVWSPRLDWLTRQSLRIHGSCWSTALVKMPEVRFGSNRYRVERVAGLAMSAMPRKRKYRARLSGLRQDQAVSAYRHPLRQTRSQYLGFVGLAAIRIWLRPYESTPARMGEFLQTIQSDLPGPVRFAKIFRFAADPNQIYIHAIPFHLRGVSRSSRT
jgi:hypothetical protein